MAMRLLVLVNRKARQGSAPLAAQLDRLRDVGCRLLEAPTASAAEVSAAIEAHAGRADGVILGGGDGTINAAAPGLLRTGLPFGLLPLGTANDLARTLGIPDDLGEAVEIIAAGHVRRIDLGQVNDRYFFNAASLGMSVKMTHRLTGAMKRRWGPLAYGLAAARTLFSARPMRLEITHAGAMRRVKTSFVAVRNGTFFGGGFCLDPDDRIDDGKLTLYSLELKRWWDVIPMLPSLLRGTFKDTPRAYTAMGTEFAVRTVRRPRQIITDGEITTRTPAVFRVLPRAVAVFAPPPG